MKSNAFRSFTVSGRLRAGLVCAALLAFTPAARALGFSVEKDGRRSVVKIYVTAQRGNYAMPWQTQRPMGGTGSGFILGKRRILTNAHLAADVRFLEIQKDGDPRRYPAEVAFIAHDCDLAVLSVSDPGFFEDTASLALAPSLPNLNDDVTVLGYPLGGARMSVTRGVVSRLDYNTYAHSGVDQHMVLQVDAAINPGNSGGPILYNGRVVGLAFQGLSWAENIGYAIPLPVIRHFLDDIEDGTYNGYPELGASTLELRNPALRKDFGLPPGKNGVVVYYLDPFGSARNLLQPRDVLTAIDGNPIASDGTILLDGSRAPYHEILERKQWGASILFDVWRNGAGTRIQVPLRNPRDPFAYRNLYDEKPQYLIVGGLVFAPLTREYLRSIGSGNGDRNTRQLGYYAMYGKLDGHFKGHVAFIVLVHRLPHAVNAYMDDFVNGIVEDVNGRPIGGMSALKAALSHSRDGYHLMRFAGMDAPLVLDATAAVAADPEVFERYGIAAGEYIEEEAP